MRGQKKRKKHLFKPGHVYLSNRSGNSRASPVPSSVPAGSRNLELGTGTTSLQTNCRTSGHSYSLRSRSPQAPSGIGDDVDVDLEKSQNIVVSIDKLENFINNVFNEHRTFQPACKGRLIFPKSACQHVGMGVKAFMSCSQCSFISSKHKMYSEVDTGKRGCKAASLNRSLSVGLLNSPIGVSNMRYLLATTNIKPPAVSCMQKNLNFVGEVVVKEEEDKLRQERLNLKRKKSGEDPGKEVEIDVECDAQYNNRLFSTLNPLQGGTQCTFTVCENETNDKKVIAVVTSSKLCTKGERMRRHDKTVICPNHEGCTANLAYETPIGLENVYATKAAEMIKSDGLRIRSVTTDGDSKATKGFESVFGSGIEKLKDQRHFSLCHLKCLRSATFSPAMFTAKTKRGREREQRLFADDVRSRCEAEFNAAFEKFGASTDMLIESLSETPNAIIACYSGSCDLCKLFSHVCNGESGGRWPKHHLPPSLKKGMSFSTDDRKAVHDLINKRLGPSALQCTRKCSTTQKSEAMNKAYTKTNPKSVTSVRNFPARIHSAIMTNNLGLEMATTSLCKSVGQHLCGVVNKSLSKIEQQRQRIKLSKRRPDVKARRVYKRLRNYKIVMARQTKNNGEEDEGYRKGIDMEVLQ